MVNQENTRDQKSLRMYKLSFSFSLLLLPFADICGLFHLFS